MTPYEKGYDCGYCNTWVRNPYEKDTDEYEEWQSGFYDGLEELEAEEDQ